MELHVDVYPSSHLENGGCDRRSASSRGAPVTSTAPEDGTTKHHPGPPCDSILIQSCLIPPIRSVASRPRRYDPKGSAGSTPRRGRSRGPGRGADWRGPDPAAVFGQAQYIPRPPMVVVHPERNPFRNELGSNRCPGFDLVPVASECCAFLSFTNNPVWKPPCQEENQRKRSWNFDQKTQNQGPRMGFPCHKENRKERPNAGKYPRIPKTQHTL